MLAGGALVGDRNSSTHRRKPPKAPLAPRASSPVALPKRLFGSQLKGEPKSLKRKSKRHHHASAASVAADWGENLIGRRIRFMRKAKIG